MGLLLAESVCSFVHCRKSRAQLRVRNTGSRLFCAYHALSYAIAGGAAVGLTATIVLVGFFNQLRTAKAAGGATLRQMRSIAFIGAQKSNILDPCGKASTAPRGPHRTFK